MLVLRQILHESSLAVLTRVVFITIYYCPGYKDGFRHLILKVFSFICSLKAMGLQTELLQRDQQKCLTRKQIRGIHSYGFHSPCVQHELVIAISHTETLFFAHYS